MCRCRSLTLNSLCSYQPLCLEEQDYTLTQCRVLSHPLVLSWCDWTSEKQFLANLLQVSAASAHHLCCWYLSRQHRLRSLGRLPCSYLNWSKHKWSIPLHVESWLSRYHLESSYYLLPNCFIPHRCQSIKTKLWEMCGSLIYSDRLIIFWDWPQLG